VSPVSDVLVINADLGPLHRVTLRHAIRMLVRQVAELHEFEMDKQIGIFPMPKVVRLVRYIYTKWRNTAGPSWTRAGVLKRDKRICGYCRAAATTVDHIQPRSRGGQNNWKNTVAACDPCNQRKADRNPREAGMVLLATPSAPTWVHLAQA
jgi:5-methylcytosine-specific restriction endonuclease McrA